MILNHQNSIWIYPSELKSIVIQYNTKPWPDGFKPVAIG